MGETFRAVRTGAGGFEREVAIKVIRPDQADDPELREQFLREGKLAGALHHRAIVQVFDAGVDGDEFYLVMEYLRGVDLRRLARAQGGRLPWRAAVWIAGEAARGLEAAHESGIIHRDVSPSNLMACADGAVKVLDFGLARPAGGERSSSRLSGKLPYIAPETANGSAVDQRVDLYALGVTLYWMMTGVQPFEGKNELDTIQRIMIGRASPPSELVAAIPGEIDALVARAMARDPAARFASAGAMADALEAAVAGGYGPGDLARLVKRVRADTAAPVTGLEATTPARTPTTGLTDSLLPPARSRRAVWWWAAAAVVALGGAALLAVVLRGRAAQAERPATPPAPATAPATATTAPPATETPTTPSGGEAASSASEDQVTPAEPAPRSTRSRSRRAAREKREAEVDPGMPIRY
jgi:eukaryotic-like serine/threonine-protein kinase